MGAGRKPRPPVRKPPPVRGSRRHCAADRAGEDLKRGGEAARQGLAQEISRADGLDAIISSIADPVIIYDMECRPVRANEAGRQYMQAQDSDAWNGLAASRALKGETVRNMEQRILGPEGEERTVMVSSAPIISGGETTGAISSFHDITPLKDAERVMQQLVSELGVVTAEALRRADELDTILASITEPVVMFDGEGDPVRANAAARSYLGFDPTGMSGRQFFDRLQLHAERPGAGTDDLGSSRALNGETVRDAQLDLTDVRGDRRTVLSSCSPLMSAGKVAGAVCSLHDITERRKTEEALKRAKEDWERTFDSVPVLIAILNTQHRIVRVNKAMADKLHLPPERCIGMTCFSCVHGTDAPIGLCPHLMTMLDGKGHVAEIHEERLGGDFHISTTPLLDDKGKIIGSVHIARDITERKRSEERQRYMATFPELNPNPVMELDMAGNFTFRNAATGRVLKEAGLEDPKSLLPEDFGGVLDELKKKPGSTAIRDVTVGEHVFQVSIFQPENRDRLRLYAIDVTERKRAEESMKTALRDTNRRRKETSALLAGSRHVLEAQDFNVAARRIFDGCLEVIGARSGYVALLSDDGAFNELLFLESGGMPCTVDTSLPMPIRGLRAEAYRTGRPVYDNRFPSSEHARFLPGGHVTLQNVLFAPLVLDGSARGLLGLANKPGGFTDDDARMAAAFGELAAIALRNSQNLINIKDIEETNRIVLENMGEAVVFADPSGNVTYLNLACRDLLGYSPEELAGKPLGFIHPEDHATVREAYGRAAGGKTKVDVLGRVIARSGETLSISISWVPVMKGPNLRSMIGIMRSVSRP
jgi:PAS domain S-box-containing protein